MDQMDMKYEGVDILYCDNHVLVAVKPLNVPSQQDISRDPDMLSMMRSYVGERYQKPGAVYLGLVHRLDRPVSGLMVFARTSKAAARLCEQVRERTMKRGYVAVVRGVAEDSARLCDQLAKEDGTLQHAALSYTCLARQDGFSLVDVSLETGRKHQIRLQMAGAGLPIYGDRRHGGGTAGQQIALFAWRLCFVHPTLRETMTFEAPMPTGYPWDLFEGM